RRALQQAGVPPAHARQGRARTHRSSRARRHLPAGGAFPLRPAEALTRLRRSCTMAEIKTFRLLTFGFLRHPRADAGVHGVRLRNGRPVKSGRGLSFWFSPHRASIAELPVDDRSMVLFFKGRSKDFQAVTVQGNLTWRVADPEALGMRVDFSID